MVGEGIQNSMNDSPVDIGIENNLPERRHPDRGQAAADDGAEPLRGPLVEREVQLGRRVFPPGHRQHRRTGGHGVQEPASTRSATCSTRRCRMRWSAASCSGDAGRISRTDSVSDGLKLQFSFKYNFSHKLGG